MKILSLPIFIVTLSLVVTSCQNNQSNKEVAMDKIDTEQTRSTKHKIMSKAYHYKSLANITKGNTDISFEEFASLGDKNVSFVVLYEASAPWSEIFTTGIYEETGSDLFNGLIESYALEITDQFAIDDDTEGLVLDPLDTIDNPIEAAREISLIENVLMVQVKEVPKEVPVENQETASTDN